MFDQVRKVLEQYPETRENDGLLVMYWLKDHRSITTYEGILRLANANKFNFESVRRARQKIQAAGEFLPSCEKIRKRRGLEKIYQQVMAN
ncbi:TPA: hypothetical protein QCX76_004911 [Bacillus pacificus]|nr:hypothetical protein [Bacillus pacificus]HDR7653555.1 hypothetical protein [Bacillus pacificus]